MNDNTIAIDAEYTEVGRNAKQKSSGIPQTPFRFLFWMAKRYRISVSLTFLCCVVGYGAEALLPYFTKRFIDATNSFFEGNRLILLIGAGIFATYLIGSLILRVSGFLGIQFIISLKKEIYRLFTQQLAHDNLNDEPGTIIQSISIIGEGSEQLLYHFFWRITGFIMSFVIHLILMFSVHAYIFGIISGWILLHLLTNPFLAKWRKSFAIKYEIATSQLKGKLVGFCRNLMYEPGQVNLLSEEIYELDKTLENRASRQLTDWRIAEAILLFYNFIHGFFIIALLIVVLVLWQDTLISTGDVAMSLAILISTQKMLRDVSSILNHLTVAYARVEAGLKYLNTTQLRGLMAPKF